MSNEAYIKHLERVVSASTKVINDLTQENYELKQLIRASPPYENDSRTYKSTHDD